MQPNSGYAIYTKPTIVRSLGTGEELILHWSFQRSSSSDGWQRVALRLAPSTAKGYGHSYNTQDFEGAIGFQSGGTYGGNGGFSVMLTSDTLYDMRTVLTANTISHKYKERTSGTWLVANSRTGDFNVAGVDQVFIDCDNSGFNIDTISLTVNQCTKTKN